MNNDLISRKAAIEAIYALHEDGEEGISRYLGITDVGSYPYLRDDYTEGLADCISEIECLPSANQWIPCSERLPNEHGEYLVYYKTNRYEHIKILEYGIAEQYGETINNCWFKPNLDFNDSIYNNVIAWQPLPEPYVEVEE